MKIIKKAFLSLLLICLFLPLFPTQKAAAVTVEGGYYIQNYDVQLVANDKHESLVTETIDVYFTQSHQGIIRDIPYSSSAEKVSIKDISVQGETFVNESTPTDFILRIGDAGVYLTGKKRYIIQYTLVHYANTSIDKDYLYENLIGTGWNTYIEKATMKVKLPPQAQVLNYTVTAGAYGSKVDSSSRVTSTQNGNVITLSTTNRLEAYEGVTLNVEMAKGAFPNAPVNALPLIIIVISLLGLLLTAFCFFKFGKDQPLAPVVEFYAPDAMSPALIGYVIDETANNRDITSLVFYWASHNHIAIENNDGDTILHKRSELDEVHPEFEKSMFASMFAIGGGEKVNTSDLTNVFYTTVNTTKYSIQGYFSGKKELSNMKAKAISYFCSFCAILLSVVSIVGAFFLISSSISGIWPYALFGAVPTVIIVGLTYGYLRGMNKRSKAANIAFKVCIGILAIVFGIVLAAILVVVGFEWYAGIIVALAVYGMAIWAPFITKRSEYGQKILERVVGFKQFLQDAEKDKLEALLKENPDYYYDILPYALVLGVTTIWAKKFDDLVTEPPQWYMGNNNTFSTIIMANYMMNSMNSVSTAMTSVPQNTGGRGGFGGGFGGGGFSGGGSGGGGGGAW